MVEPYRGRAPPQAAERGHRSNMTARQHDKGYDRSRLESMLALAVSCASKRAQNGLRVARSIARLASCACPPEAKRVPSAQK